ncbi:MAG: CinA family protein [Bacteroidales bacterium]|nr:CinA family protein [Bacteroidales bacterium]
MIQEEIAEIFFKTKKTLAVAESCTGGYLSHLITSVPGCSEFFMGSVVSYSNEAKRSILNVRELNLKKHGAVSEFVVNDMAINTMGLFDVDYSIATSGIAGPSGGTDEKPVGTVWICVATTTRFNAKVYHFDPELGRIGIAQKASETALEMLKEELEKDIDK